MSEFACLTGRAVTGAILWGDGLRFLAVQDWANGPLRKRTLDPIGTKF